SGGRLPSRPCHFPTLRRLQECAQAPLTTERELATLHDESRGDVRGCHLDPADRVSDSLAAPAMLGAHFEQLEFFDEPLQSARSERRETLPALARRSRLERRP